ncbi:MAG: serine hydrolase domain-containing protein [Ilumatobacteraceae bacterium]
MKGITRGALVAGSLAALTCLVACSSSDPTSSSSPASNASDPATTSAPSSTETVVDTSAETVAVAAALDGELLTEWLTEAVAKYPNSPGHLMWVISPEYTGGAAAGTLELGASAPLEVDTPIRVASVTKTFVAASVLRLAEMGELTLDDPISQHLSPTYLEMLSTDGYDVEAITIRHLLTHTSGIADYAGYEENYEGEFQRQLEADPTFQWNRELEVQFAMDNYDPLAAPGAEFHYADTGYVLLGDLLERAMNVPSYGAALAELLGFDELGLTSTFVERLDRPAPDKPLGHQYIGTLDYTNIDPGQDMYGGGGIVSTTREVSMFFDALLGGRIFDKPETLTEMITPAADAEPGSEAASEGLGIFLVKSPSGETCYSHSGYGGTTATTCPDSGITITITVQQVDAPAEDYPDPVGRVFESLN